MTATIAIFIAAFVTSLVSTPYGRKIGIWLNMMDQPGTRKIHRTAAVRSGGLAVAFGLIAGYVAMMLLITPHAGLVLWREALILVAALLASLGGFRDDVSPIRARTRVFVQIASAVVFLFAIEPEVSAYAAATGIPLAVLFPGCVVLVVTVINAVNFIDGIDGLASSLVILTAVALAISGTPDFDHMEGMAAGGVVVAGATAGFLPWNLLGYKRGRVFLGDGGSTLLGAIIAALTIRTVLNHPAEGVGVERHAQDFLFFVGLVGVPLIDEGAIVLRRLITRWPLTRGDQGHLHHLTMIHASRLPKPDRRALIKLVIVHAMVLTAALLASKNEQYRWPIAAAGAAVPLLVYARLGYFERGVFKRARKALALVQKAPRNPITPVQALRAVVVARRMSQDLGFDYVRLMSDAGPIRVLVGDPTQPPPAGMQLYRFAMVPRGLSIVLFLEVYLKRRWLMRPCVRVSMIGPVLAPLQRALGALPQRDERDTTRRMVKDHEDEKRTAPIFTHDRLPEELGQ